MAKLKLTDQLIEKACEHIRAGNYAVVVCQYLGIDETTYYRWMKTAEKNADENKNSIYRQFYQSIKRAEAEAELRNVTIIQNAAKGTWQAAAWYLERKHKDRWIAESKLQDRNDKQALDTLAGALKELHIAGQRQKAEKEGDNSGAEPEDS